MTMPFMDDFYPERKPVVASKSSDEPNFYMWGVGTMLAFVSMFVWAFGFGLLIEFWALLIMVPIAIGYWKLYHLHTLENVDDPFTH